MSRTSITSARKLRQGEAAEEADGEYWAALTPAERLNETWRLSLELWEFKGWDAGEPGLRSPARRVERR